MPFFHERQRMQHCCKHTLNNLFQAPLFSAAILDSICAQLAPGALPMLNPHRTLLLGNYDVNVLEVALSSHGKVLCWYDLRDSEFERLQLGDCWGIIVNINASGPLSWLFRGRHWFGLRCLEGRWYNLDSHLQQPQPMDAQGLGDEVAVRRFLAQQVRQHDAKVFLVKEQAQAEHAQHACQESGEASSATQPSGDGEGPALAATGDASSELPAPLGPDTAASGAVLFEP